MPSFRRQTVRSAKHRSHEIWRPQRFGRGFAGSVHDPIVEPEWSGVRVLARLACGSVRLSDEEGDDATAEFTEAAEAIAAAALAGEFILDGYLTVEPTQPSSGVDRPPIDIPSAGSITAQMLLGSRPRRPRPNEPVEPGRPIDPDRPIAFVAVDLLSIDATSLLDVPLLERKRLLEGALLPGELVRITPFVRPPIGSFIATWQASGLRGVAYKSANSRYLPGEKNPDWVAVPISLQRR